jgi:hypothetical protein
MIKFRVVAPVLCCAMFANAAVITTNSGFLGTYTGPQNQDLNVLTAQVSYNGTSYTFTSTMGAAIGTTTGVDYIWGVDRGLLTNEANFGAFAPGVLFDAVVVLSFSGGVASGFVDDIANNVVTPLAGGSVTVSGSTITGVIPAALLPSNAFTPAQYMVNLWPSVGIPGQGGATTANIAEFAPSVNADAAVTVTAPTSTPAPTSISLLAIGLICIAALIAMRKRAANGFYS